jgi:hypothetical protein
MAQWSDRMGDQNLLFRAPPCFGRHVKLLVPAAFAVVATTPVSRCFSSQPDEKHVVSTPLCVIRLGKRKKINSQNVAW